MDFDKVRKLVRDVFSNHNMEISKRIEVLNKLFADSDEMRMRTAVYENKRSSSELFEKYSRSKGWIWGTSANDRISSSTSISTCSTPTKLTSDPILERRKELKNPEIPLRKPFSTLANMLTM
ncbi:hypothetical protein JTB14_010594 [Gonioctena quinquepunctata]|nr:hypothetical protein JTB14_010594 [Gonioctena quinquepunctata]